MLTPEMNPDGYNQSAVNNMTGFENTRYLLVHGTGDDNGIIKKRGGGEERSNSYPIQLLTRFYNSSLSKRCCIGRQVDPS
jgi:hypothetical protein